MKNTASHVSSPSVPRVSARPKTLNTQAPLESSLVSVHCDLLNPSPFGEHFSDEAITQAVKDLARVSMFASLEPVIATVVGSEEGGLVLRRYRIAFIVERAKLIDLVDHERSYTATVFEHHPVFVSVQGMFGL